MFVWGRTHRPSRERSERAATERREPPSITLSGFVKSQVECLSAALCASAELECLFLLMRKLLILLLLNATEARLQNPAVALPNL